MITFSPSATANAVSKKHLVNDYVFRHRHLPKFVDLKRISYFFNVSVDSFFVDFGFNALYFFKFFYWQFNLCLPFSHCYSLLLYSMTHFVKHEENLFLAFNKAQIFIINLRFYICVMDNSVNIHVYTKFRNRFFTTDFMLYGLYTDAEA